MINYELIGKALCFATNAHSSQTRDDGGPFIAHPVRVFHHTLRYTEDSEILAAALLHDVVEDCGVRPDIIELTFTKRVRQLVDELTNDYSDHLAFQAKLEATRLKTSKLSDDGKLIKLADRWDNFNSMKIWKPLRQLKYCHNTLTLLLAMETLPSHLHNLRDGLYSKLRNTILRLDPDGSLSTELFSAGGTND